MSYIRVASASSGNVTVPQYWQQQIVSPTQSNVFYNDGYVGIGVPLPKASLHAVNNCAIGSGFATSTVPSDSLIVSGNVGIGTNNPSKAFHVVGDAIVQGNLTVSGTQTIVNTETQVTDQLIVENAGTGPALKVTQTGAQPIADFYDDNNVLALRVADGGNVGIGTATPTAKLDVNGNGLIRGSLRITNIPVVYAVNNSSTTWTTFATNTIVTFTDAYVNNGNSFNLVTHTFTAPISGYYRCHFNGLGGRYGGNGTVLLYRNGTQYGNAIHYNMNGVDLWLMFSGERIIYCNVNDTLAWYINNSLNSFHLGYGYTQTTIQFIG